MKKRGLGKGLDALFSSDEQELDETHIPEPEEAEEGAENQDQKVRIVDIYSVEPDREQIRSSSTVYYSPY